MKTFRSEGFVIKRRNFQEADRIVTIFLKNGRKIEARAPGVRKINSRRSPHIELFNYCNFSFYLGKKLPVLTEVEGINTYKEIRENLRTISAAYYVCEIVDGLCPINQENSKVFYLIKKIFESLKTESDLEKITKEFEIELLDTLGFYKSADNNLNFNPSAFIEKLLERKIKSKQIETKLLSD